jgi:deoxyribodipyrimidine photo-lyase
MDIAIVWFRQDLRLTDNPALYYAAKQYSHILPLYILDENLPWSPGAAQQWWLHHSLHALQQQFKKLGLTLILKRGAPSKILLSLCKEHKIAAVYWNRCYEPAVIERDKSIEEDLNKNAIKVTSYNGSLLIEPWEISNKQGSYFKVFTPFYNQLNRQIIIGTPLPKPNLKRMNNIQSDQLSSWQLLPTKPNWAIGFERIWQPGELAAQEKLDDFIAQNLVNYTSDRDFPAKNGTSELSPYLHFGEISPKQIGHCIKQEVENTFSYQVEQFLRQLAWREFSYHFLYHFPGFPEENFQKKFDYFTWATNKKLLNAWQRGQTGYPIVDAGMRELWSTGYMHNRVRMITASFLTKHLLIDWRKGAKWFWDTLVDADLANNSMGWQWVAGSGVDASPYYRIFNPILQGKKFDPDGQYVKQWVPELKQLSNKYLHQPWQASSKILKIAGINLGKDYPKPVVEHDFARNRALQYYRKLK